MSTSEDKRDTGHDSVRALHDNALAGGEAARPDALPDVLAPVGLEEENARLPSLAADLADSRPDAQPVNLEAENARLRSLAAGVADSRPDAQPVNLEAENARLRSLAADLADSNAALEVANAALTREVDLLKEALRRASAVEDDDNSALSGDDTSEYVEVNSVYEYLPNSECEGEPEAVSAEYEYEENVARARPDDVGTNVGTSNDENETSDRETPPTSLPLPAVDSVSQSDPVSNSENEEKEIEVLRLPHLATSIYEELDATLDPLEPVPRVVVSFPDMSSFTAPLQYIASGAFGLVFKTEIAGKPIVLKVSKFNTDEARSADYNEWAISEKLAPHPNVLQISGLCPMFKHPTYKRIGTTALALPYMENGNLRGFLDRTGFDPRNEWQLANVVFGMLEGVRSLHEQGVLHRDIALRNYLVDDNGRVLLSDFGLARYLGDSKNKVVLVKSDGKDAENEDLEVLIDEVGPHPWRWIAPECFEGKFSRKSDIWMLGQAVVELVTNHPPWPQHSNSKTLRAALTAGDLQLPPLRHISGFIRDLVHKCCDPSPLKRPSAGQLSRLMKARMYDIEYSGDDSSRFALHKAATSGDLKYINKCLRESEDPDLKDKNGMTALHVAALRADAYAVEALMFQREGKRTPPYFIYVPFKLPQQVCSYIATDKQNNTVFHHIAAAGLSCHLLTKYFESIHSKDAYGDDLHRKAAIHDMNSSSETAFYIAVSSGHCGVVEDFDRVHTVMYGDDTEGAYVVMCHGHSFLHKAIDICNDGMIQCLLKHGAEKYGLNTKDNSGRTPLMLAALRGYSEAVALLLSCPKVDVNARSDFTFGIAPVIFTVIQGLDFKLFRMLLDHSETNVNLRHNHNTPLLELCEVIRCAQDQPQSLMKAYEFLNALLLHESLDVSAPNRALETACGSVWRTGFGDLIKALSSHPHLDIKSAEKYLHRTLECTYVTQVLLSYKSINVNSRCWGGETALFHAINDRRGRIPEESVQLLLAHPDIDVTVKNGKHTALEEAVVFHHSKHLKLLLSHPDIDINAPLWENGKTPLSYVCVSYNWSPEHERILEILLADPRIDTNQRSASGMNALMAAVNCKHPNLCAVNLLLAHPAFNVNAQMDDGTTALIMVAKRLITEAKWPDEQFCNKEEHLRTLCNIYNNIAKHPRTDVTLVDEDGHNAEYYFRQSQAS